MSQYSRYPISGGVPVYTSAAQLPVLTYDGALAVTADTDTLYVFHLATVTWLVIGSGGSTVTAIGVFGSSPNSAGGSIAGNTLTLQPASASFPGGVSILAQTFAGIKTFQDGIYYKNPGASSVARIISSWISDQVVSVKDFGAVGNGSTDDTTAIQNTVTAAAGKTVFFPSGTYAVSAPITLANNTRMLGAGSSSIIAPLAGAGVTYFFGGTSKSNISIENLKFSGGGTWTSTPFANPFGGGNSVGFTSGSKAIFLASSSNIQVKDCEFTGFNWGIYLDGGDVSTDVLISRCYIHTMGASGISLFNSSKVTIDENIIQTIQGNQTAAGDTTVADSKFADCILICSSQDVIISNNNCYDFNRCGVVVQPNGAVNSARILVANNVVDYGHDARGTEFNTGIYLGDSFLVGPNAVVGNVVNNIAYTGIVAQECLISGGSVYNCAVYGINPVANVSIIGVDIQLNKFGIVASSSGASNTFAIKNCIIKGNTFAGVLFDSCHGAIEISGNTVIDNGGSTTSRAATGSCAGVAISGYYNDQQVFIRNNIFVSSANHTATSGQLYGILGYAGGDFNYTAARVEDNRFEFTGTNNSYPTCMGQQPVSFAYDNTSVISLYEIIDANGNFNSKPPAEANANFGYLSGFPRFLGYTNVAPASGAYLAGDYFLNDAIASGQPWFFVCVASGSPGTWESWGYGSITVAAVGSSPNSAGASAALNVLTLQPANGSNPGVLTAGTQTIGGAKTFSGNGVFSGTLGVGGAVPTNVVLYAQNSTPAASPTWISADTAVLAGTSNSVLNIHVGVSGGTAGVNFGYASTRGDGYIGYDTGNRKILIGANSATQLTIDNTGAVFTGLVTITAPGTNNAPALHFSGTNDSQSGWYCSAGALYYQTSMGNPVLSFLSYGVQMGQQIVLANSTAYGDVMSRIDGKVGIRNAGDFYGQSLYISQAGGTYGANAIRMLANAATTAYTITWPGAVAAATSVLQSDSSGVLSWATSGGDLTLAAFGSSPNANGASLSSQVLTLQPASGSQPGGVSTTTQTFAGAKTFSGQLIGGGTTTNDNAAAGVIGEVVSSVVARVGVALTTATQTDVTSISLTAGDWDISGLVCFAGSPVGALYADAGINTTSATLGTIGDTYYESLVIPSATNDASLPFPTRRYSLSGSATVYLITRMSFTSGTVNAYGRIQARRVR